MLRHFPFIKDFLLYLPVQNFKQLKNFLDTDFSVSKGNI